jgi:hypothetical protein
MAINMISSTDNRKASFIMDAWSDNKPVPWVRAGNLYLTMLRTGSGDLRTGDAEGQWPEVVDYIFKKATVNSPKILVITGRHGAIFGGFQPKGKVMEHHVDQELFNDDKELLRLQAMKNSKYNSAVRVVNAGRYDKKQLIWWTTAVLRRGVSVIYAWCHSLFTMYEVDWDSFAQQAPLWISEGIADWNSWTTSKDVATETMSQLVTEVEDDAGRPQSNKSIHQITQESYSWVPNLINSVVSF